MAPAPSLDELARWRECPDCGLFQTMPPIADGEKANCTRCGALLRRAAVQSIGLARANAIVAAAMFVVALTLPLVRLNVLSRVCTATVFSGPHMLAQDGLLSLGWVVALTLLVMPAAKLALQLTVLLGVERAKPIRWLPWLYGWHARVSPWAMVEVFMLGSFVAYTRLRDLAHVDIGLAAVALGGVMLCMVATDATLDHEAVWQKLEAKSPQPPQKRPDETLLVLGCDECGRVTHGQPGEKCPRCAHPLHHRRGGLGRAWALLLAAALLYVPANVLPVMTVERLGKGGPTTILHGVVELADAHLWPLAILVLVASIIVPVFKLISLAMMLVMTQRRSGTWLPLRTRTFRLVRFVGRWSMIDIFMLTVLVGVVRFGSIAVVLPGNGALAFCAVVVLTMIATESFDPRRMWDAPLGHETSFPNRVSCAAG